jgi:NTP pyrophosphatase (non-canonical NTP hydrolase)
VCEEAGELARAVIDGPADHAAEEAADVVIAAVCVLLVLSRDPLAEVARKLSAVEGRP